MLGYILKYKIYIIGIVFGAIAGFLYWRFIGCTSGTCPITSKWYTTSMYGALMGGVLSSPNKKKKITKN